MDDSKVFMFPENRNNGIDATTALLLGNNGGFGGMNNPLWMMFMYPFILPFINMFGGGFGFGNGMWGNNMFGGTGFLSNQLNNDAGRDLILQAINGKADALGQLAGITNQSVDTVREAIATMSTKLSEVGAQVGMSGLQVINAVQSGNATIGRQLCECCCENRLAIANQTNALQSNLAAHDASVRLQLAQNEAADQLSVCQQTNTLSTQNERNTNNLLNAIANQSTMITKEFCELKERELQNKIDTLTADNAILRSNMNNNMQTQQFAAMLAPINAELAAIKAAQPATITVPNNQYVAVPSYFATGAVDFVSSYWANRLSNLVPPVTGGTTTTTTNS